MANSMRRTLDFQLKQLAYRARTGKLEGARLVGGALVVSPLESEVPDAAKAIQWELNSFLPNVHITDLLAEVDGWTGFADKFTHLRTGDMVRNRSASLAAVLADATNLGPKRMAEASSNVSERQISWARFHVRPETYRAAQAAIIDAHRPIRTPLLGRRRDVVFRRAILPRQRPRRRPKRREPPLRQRARYEIL